MSRRPALRSTDLNTAIDALKRAGMTPAALDILPDGTHRWHFTKPVISDDDEAEQELREFRKKHGYD